MKPLPGELLETRVRPMRRSLVRRAVAPCILLVWAVVVAVLALPAIPLQAPGPFLSGLALVPAGLLGAVAARWAGTATYPPVLLSVAAGLVAAVVGLGPLAAATLLAVGAVAWLGLLEAWRRRQGIDLTTHGILVRSGWRAHPVRVSYADVRAVEPRRAPRRHWGALIFETEHGLFPVQGLAHVGVLAARIEARIHGGAPVGEVEAAQGVAKRLKTLLG